MTMINLVPADVLIRRESRSRSRLWVCRLLAGLFVLGFLYTGFHQVAAGRGDDARQMTGRYESLLERIRSAENLIQERNRLARRRQAIEMISANQPVCWFFETLGEALPPRSYLDQFGISRCQVPRLPDSEEDGPCRAGLRLRGRAPAHKDIGEIIRNLMAREAFEDVGLVTAREKEVASGRTEIEFEIQCRVAEVIRDD